MSKGDKGFVQVFAVLIDRPIDQCLFNELILKINPLKQKKIKKFNRLQDAYLTLFADLLLRKVLLEANALRPDQLIFCVSEFGKPCLKYEDFIHFNLSHSGQWVVCAVDSYPIGVDIEKIESIDISIAKNFFSIDEYNDIISNSQPIVRFFEYWTLKESFVKFNGKGLSQTLNSFCICFKGRGEFVIKLNNVLEKGIYFKQYKLQEDYKMSICATHNNFSKKCIVYSIKDVIQTASLLKDNLASNN